MLIKNETCVICHPIFSYLNEHRFFITPKKNQKGALKPCHLFQFDTMLSPKINNTPFPNKVWNAFSFSNRSRVFISWAFHWIKNYCSWPKEAETKRPDCVTHARIDYVFVCLILISITAESRSGRRRRCKRRKKEPKNVFQGKLTNWPDLNI